MNTKMAVGRNRACLSSSAGIGLVSLIHISILSNKAKQGHIALAYYVLVLFRLFISSFTK